MINADRNLDALTIFDDRRWHANDLPSWCPGWRFDHRRRFLNPGASDGHLDNNKAAQQDLEEYDKLVLQGRLSDTIRTLYRWGEPKKFIDSTVLGSSDHSHITEILKRADTSGFVMALGDMARWHGLERSHTEPEFFVPGHTMLEDAIVLSEGGRVPYVLRKKQDKTWIFIGPAIPTRSVSGGERPRTVDPLLVPNGGGNTFKFVIV